MCYIVYTYLSAFCTVWYLTYSIDNTMTFYFVDDGNGGTRMARK